MKAKKKKTPTVERVAPLTSVPTPSLPPTVGERSLDRTAKGIVI